MRGAMYVPPYVFMTWSLIKYRNVSVLYELFVNFSRCCNKTIHLSANSSIGIYVMQ